MHQVLRSPLLPNAAIRSDHEGRFGLPTLGNDEIVRSGHARSDEQICE